MSLWLIVHGALVVHKPVGPSSHDIVVCARRALGISRIGHTGTLDPQASGVLPLVVGQATRLAQHLTGSDKEYLATIRFGVSTDTYDAAGRVISERGGAPSAEELEARTQPVSRDVRSVAAGLLREDGRWRAVVCAARAPGKRWRRRRPR